MVKEIKKKIPLAALLATMSADEMGKHLEGVFSGKIEPATEAEEQAVEEFHESEERSKKTVARLNEARALCAQLEHDLSTEEGARNGLANLLARAERVRRYKATPAEMSVFKAPGDPARADERHDDLPADRAPATMGAGGGALNGTNDGPTPSA